MQHMIRLIAAALSLGVLAGCASVNEQQRVWLAEGQRAYEQGDYGRAMQSLDRVLAEVQQGPEAARALYVRGMSAAKTGNRAQAYADLQRCVDIATDVDVRWRANVVLGTLYFEDGRWPAAARAYEAAVAQMPAVPPLGHILFRLGQSYERAGRWAESLGPFQRIVTQVPQSNVAEAARRRLDLKADHFAIQCGAFTQAANANNLVLDLERKGFSAQVRRELRDRQVMQVVLVGRYTDYAEATGQLERVRTQIPEATLWP